MKVDHKSPTAEKYFSNSHRPNP